MLGVFRGQDVSDIQSPRVIVMADVVYYKKAWKFSSVVAVGHHVVLTGS